mmetsp:Transcript_21769/g.30697  ORF Transcript_21769/g.30697 Transcript_21769/m.30697 type:complete len:107 (+) Transcript_21769:75-395(+)
MEYVPTTGHPNTDSIFRARSCGSAAAPDRMNRSECLKYLEFNVIRLSAVSVMVACIVGTALNQVGLVPQVFDDSKVLNESASNVSARIQAPLEANDDKRFAEIPPM